MPPTPSLPPTATSTPAWPCGTRRGSPATRCRPSTRVAGSGSPVVRLDGRTAGAGARTGDEVGASVTVRLDDPLQGEVIAAIAGSRRRSLRLVGGTHPPGLPHRRPRHLPGAVASGDLRRAIEFAPRRQVRHEHRPQQRGDHHRCRPARRSRAEHGVLCAQRQAGDLGRDQGAGAGQHPDRWATTPTPAHGRWPATGPTSSLWSCPCGPGCTYPCSCSSPAPW